MIIEPLLHKNNLPPVHGQLTALRAVSLKFVQPVYLAKSKSLVFCSRSALGSLSSANSISFRVNYAKNTMVETCVPTFGDFEELTNVIEKNLGNAAGALVRQGAMPLLQGGGPETLPLPQMEELRKIAEISQKKIFYLKKEKLYVMAETIEDFFSAPHANLREIEEVSSAADLPATLNQERKNALRFLSNPPANIILIRDKGFFWVWAGFEHKPAWPMDHRGYLQVDLAQIPEAVRTFQVLAKKLSIEGKSFAFKFLLGNININTTVINSGKAIDFSDIRKLTGYYDRMSPSDPVIALYAKSKEEILSILEQLSRMPEWQKIENERMHKNRREGTSAYTNKTGQEFRTLCYLETDGCAEDFVREARENGKDWRSLVNGPRTSILSVPVDRTSNEYPS